MKFYDEHKDQRDKFEIIAIHDHRAKTLEEADKKLTDAGVIEKKWAGRNLPFVVLLDANNDTCVAYGIQFFPTTILINPDGTLVPGGEAELAKALSGN